MPEGSPDIARCPHCKSPMDVSGVGPFTNVECPACGEHTRVKCGFGPYTLLRRHAVGGMSMVFVARDGTLDREVVVKILSEAFSSDEKRIAAFEEEARITAAISHPNVVRVFTTGRAFGRFFIAMEFVQGGHFEHHISEKGAVPEAEALPLMIEVAEGLKAAWQAGLIHRDIKPGNILLDAHGKGKIVDFGLALITQGGVAKAEELWATPYYVPPEAVEGKPEDFRSDIYAFGATFYHALAGRPPCGEESMDTDKLRRAKRDIPPLRRAAEGVGPALCRIVDRCMAYDPEDRYASYGELISDLRNAEANPGDAGGGHSERKRRRSRDRTTAFAAAVVLAAIAGGVCWKLLSPVSEEPAGPVVPPVVVVAPDPVPSGDGGAGLRVASAYRSAREAMESGDYLRARELFTEVSADPQVLEPTGSWAACEAVVASLRAGRSAEARADAARALGHLGKAEGLADGVGTVLTEALEGLSDLRPAMIQGETTKVGGAHVMGWILSGLKNWEQGMPHAAVPFFEAVASAPAEGGDAWVAPYAAMARDYLSDHERLVQAEPRDFDLEREECLALIDELHALHASLRTKGRARFNVRVWQLELEKRARSKPVEAPVVAEKPAVTGFPAAVADDLAACRFGEAASALRDWTPGTDEERERRRAMLVLTDAATTFLAELADEVGAAEGLVTRDGRAIPAVTGGGAAGLRFRSEDGSEESLPWSDIRPESLIDLHRELVASEESEIERLRRHEEAIAFDLLAGDRERGIRAGERLAAVSEAFGRRWATVRPALEP